MSDDFQASGAPTSYKLPGIGYNWATVLSLYQVITQDEAEKRLHTSSAHIDFASFDWTQELYVKYTGII